MPPDLLSLNSFRLIFVLVFFHNVIIILVILRRRVMSNCVSRATVCILRFPAGASWKFEQWGSVETGI